MKKLLCILLVFVSLLSFVGCSKTDLTPDIDSLRDQISSLKDDNDLLQGELDVLKEKEQFKLPSFEDCEIGYELEVYPKVAFDYKVNEDCIVHIESITATLTAKNVINEGDILEEAFYPYVITFAANGKVEGEPPTDYMGNVTLRVELSYNKLSTSFPRIKINNDGTFVSTYAHFMLENCIIYFLEISF